MILRQLEYLVALGEHGHFGRAAAACHVSQPGLSMAVRKLEAELGVELVQRGAGGSALTPEGRALLPWARSAVAAAGAIEDEAGRLRGHLTATLRVGVVPTAAAAIPAVTGPLLDAHPGVRVETRTSSNEQIVAAIDARTLDAGLAYVDDVTGGLATVPLYRERLVLLTPAALPGAADAPVPWSRVADLDLCLLAPAMLQRRIVDAALRTAGVEATPRIETDSVAALLDLVAAGWSTVVGHPWVARRALPDGVRARPLERPVVSRPVGLLLPRGPLLAPAVRALRAALADVDVQARVGPLP